MRHLLDWCRLVLYDISASYRGWIEYQKQSITYCRLVVLNKRMTPCSLGNPHSFRDIWSHQHGSIYMRREVLAAPLLVVLRVWAPLKVALGGWKMFTILKETWGWKHNQKHIITSLFENFRSKLLMESVEGQHFFLSFFCWRLEKIPQMVWQPFPGGLFPGSRSGGDGPAAFESEDGRVAVLRSDAPGARGIYARKCQEMSKNIATWPIIDIRLT